MNPFSDIPDIDIAEYAPPGSLPPSLLSFPKDPLPNVELSNRTKLPFNYLPVTTTVSEEDGPGAFLFLVPIFAVIGLVLVLYLLRKRKIKRRVIEEGKPKRKLSKPSIPELIPEIRS